MRITENLKAKLREAKKDGFRNVYSVGGGYKSTTYCTFWGVDELLKMEIGESVRAFRANGQARWGGCPNTRHADISDISYQKLMLLY